MLHYNLCSELTFQKMKKGMSDNIEEEDCSDDGIVNEDDVFM